MLRTGRALSLSAIVCLIVLPAYQALGEPIRVGSAADARAALLVAKPGQIIRFDDGAYDLGEIRISVEASSQSPLRIQAANLGQARFVGKSGLSFVKCSHVTLEGFVFESDDGSAVQIVGSHDVRVTRNHFKLKQPPGASRTSAAQDARSHWVQIEGLDEGAVNSHHNRIDHNLFEDKHTMGNFISVGGLRAPHFQSSQHDRIDHNHFRFIGPRVPNGMEAIRAGYSWLSLSDGYTIIENNLFEECDGDPEVVSIKNCRSIVRNNTFRRNEGGLCLRHGNGTEVSGNFFFGEGKRGSLGVRPYGDDHHIYNNYFEGLKGPALQLVGGNRDYGSGELEDRELLKRHFRPRRLVVAFNTVVDCDVPAVIGSTGNWNLPIHDLTFANNLLVGGKEKSINVVTLPEPMKWLGNVVSPSAGGKPGVEVAEAQVRVMQVRTTRDGEIQRVHSPAGIVDAAACDFPKITSDIDGQQRSGKLDVGADEQSSEPVVNRPLRPADVGPSAAGD